MHPHIDIDSLQSLLSRFTPDAEWFLSQLESVNGRFKFPQYISNIISNLKIESYPLLYQNESAIGTIMYRAFMTESELKEFASELESASLEERGQFLIDFSESISSAFEDFKFPKTPKEQADANIKFNQLTPEEQAQSIKVSQHFFCSFFATFYQTLSVIVHGEKLTSLVAQSKAGDDQAFVKAVQIDKRILITIPYFIERFSKAQDDPNSDFFDLLSYRLQCAPYKGKIRHKSLWLFLSMLDQLGFLDQLSHPQILKIADDCGLGGYENRIQSVKHLSNRIIDYREFQKRGLSTTM